MSTTIAHIPNPYTPMAWLPPDIARSLTLQLHVAAGALAVSNHILKVTRVGLTPYLDSHMGHPLTYSSRLYYVDKEQAT